MGSCIELRKGENGWEGATRTVTTGEFAADLVWRAKGDSEGGDDRFRIIDLRLRGDISEVEFLGVNTGNLTFGEYALRRVLYPKLL